MSISAVAIANASGLAGSMFAPSVNDAADAFIDRMVGFDANRDGTIDISSEAAQQRTGVAGTGRVNYDETLRTDFTDLFTRIDASGDGDGLLERMDARKYFASFDRGGNAAVAGNGLLERSERARISLGPGSIEVSQANHRPARLEEPAPPSSMDF